MGIAAVSPPSSSATTTAKTTVAKKSRLRFPCVLVLPIFIYLCNLSTIHDQAILRPSAQDEPLGTLPPSRSSSAASNDGSTAMCAIQKGALPYVDEWVDYHLAIGFDKIVIYDNSDDFELKPWFDARNRNSSTPATLEIEHFPGTGQQLAAYDHCARRGISQSWIAFFDLDEFLVLKQHGHISELMAALSDDVGALVVNWYMFDYNQEIEYRHLPLTKRFTRRDKSPNQHVKSIVRTSKYESAGPTPHHFRYNDAHAITTDSSGHHITHDPHFNPGGPTDTVVLHHMSSKSVEEFESRCQRGRATMSKSHDLESGIVRLYCKNRTEIMLQFNHSNVKNMVFDDTAWQVLKERVPKYVKYDSQNEG